MEFLIVLNRQLFGKWRV